MRRSHLKHFLFISSLCDGGLHLTDDVWPAWQHINHPGGLAPPTHAKLYIPVPQQHGCQ